MTSRHPLRAITGGRASEPARPHSLPPLTRAVWRWLSAPVAMLIDMWADETEYLADDDDADTGAASDTCSGGGCGTPSPEPFGRKLGRFIGDLIGAVSLVIILFVLLFLGSAIQ